MSDRELLDLSCGIVRETVSLLELHTYRDVIIIDSSPVNTSDRVVLTCDERDPGCLLVRFEAPSPLNFSIDSQELSVCRVLWVGE